MQSWEWTDKERELLVKMVASGKNTYKDLHTAFPEVNDWQFMGRKGREVYKELIKMDRKFEEGEVWNYKPVDSDTFHLNRLGEDFLDKINKKEYEVNLAEEAIKKAEVANALSKDSNETSDKSLSVANQSRWIAIISVIIALSSFLYTVFSK